MRGASSESSESFCAVVTVLVEAIRVGMDLFTWFGCMSSELSESFCVVGDFFAVTIFLRGIRG
jgi:hypothetical protein